MGEMLPPTFEDWLGWTFDRQVEYHALAGPVRPVIEPEIELHYVTEVFRDAGHHLAAFGDACVARGLWSLANESGLHLCREPSLPAGHRAGAIHAMESLYRDVFFERCADRCSAGAVDPVGALNDICYRWWDVAASSPHLEPPLVDACLDVMSSTVALDHAAVRESALRGLSRLAGGRDQHERRRQGIVRRVLADARLTDELRAYAGAALAGSVA
jgi:hypothetical protein